MAIDPQKLANDARVNGIFNPTIPDAPPKAINAFTDGLAPENLGSGQQGGIVRIGERIKFDTLNGRIIIADETGIDRVLIGFLENGF
jgi:hypothetical protein